MDCVETSAEASNSIAARGMCTRPTVDTHILRNGPVLVISSDVRHATAMQGGPDVQVAPLGVQHLHEALQHSHNRGKSGSRLSTF